MSDSDQPDSDQPDSEEPGPDLGPRRRFVDLAPLTQSPVFARLWIGSAVSMIGAMLTIVAVGLQIYAITKSTFAVSLVGGISLIPMIIAGLWGGMLADAFDRRLVLIVSSLTGWVATLGLIALSTTEAISGGVPVWPFYVFTTISAIATTITSATRSSVYPRILPLDLVSRASALNGISLGMSLTVGPAIAGVLVAFAGFPWTFAVDGVLFTAGFAGILSLPKLPPIGAAARPGLRSLLDGIAFLRSAPNIRMSFLVDIIAMSFGRTYVIFPAVGALVIGGGAITVGILTAAAAIGTFSTSLLSGPVAHVHRHGIAIERAIMIYGAFVTMFGVVVAGMLTGRFGPVTSSIAHVNMVALILASIALAGTGASDEVSAIFRSTMLLTAAPDEMRGRLQGVFTIVVTGGPRIGDLYMGIFATIVALWFPPLIGGLLIIALIAVLVRVYPSFRAYDARTPTL